MATVVVEGLDELLAKLDKLSGKKIDLTQAFEKSCVVVENRAKEDCPVASGRLRNSITHKASKMQGTVGTTVAYAPYVEYGTGIYASGGRTTPWVYPTLEGEFRFTRGQKPQPYLIPALTSNKDKILEIFVKELEAQLKK